jgi:hypothetical protein
MKTFPIILKALFGIVAIHFVGNKHPPINTIINYKVLYNCRFAIHMCLTWLQTNHLEYKDIPLV